MKIKKSGNVLVLGNPDGDDAVYITQEHLQRRLYIGWSLSDIVEFHQKEVDLKDYYAKHRDK